MARDLLFHALDVCTTHRTLYNARRGKNADEIAAAEAAVNKLYETFDFPEIVRHLAWAEANLAEANIARYGGLSERRQEVEIAIAIRDKAKAARDEIRGAVINPQAEAEPQTTTDVAPDGDAV